MGSKDLILLKVKNGLSEAQLKYVVDIVDDLAENPYAAEEMINDEFVKTCMIAVAKIQEAIASWTYMNDEDKVRRGAARQMGDLTTSLQHCQTMLNKAVEVFKSRKEKTEEEIIKMEDYFK